MLKEPKVECIIMACFGPDALDPNMPDPPSHANQIWAGFAQHDLGLPWKNETELDHVGNHILGRMKLNWIMWEITSLEEWNWTGSCGKSHLPWFRLHAGHNGHKQNASRSDPACLLGMRDTEHCKITSKPSKQKCLCVEIVILNAMCLWPCWWRMNKLRRLEAFAVSPTMESGRFLMCAVWLCEILSLHSAINIQTWCQK